MRFGIDRKDREKGHSDSNSRSNRKKILLVSPFPLMRGGVQLFLLNLVRALPQEEYSFTWYCRGIEDASLAEEFVVEGVRIVSELPPSSGMGGLAKQFYCFGQLYRLCREEKFQLIHIHTSNLRFQAEALLAAIHAGIKYRIAHGHSVPRGTNRLKAGCLRWLIRHTTAKIAACSSWAAEYMCGQKHIDEAMIFTNCIDTERFAFSAEKRASCRKRLGLEDNALVIGHVGSFTYLKNHRFLLETFRIAAEKNSQARLLLVGGGEFMNQIKEQAVGCALAEKVIFAGVTDRVDEYLSAMDAFVLPSIEEGLSFVSLEAQASGLRCLVSDVVPPEARIREDFAVMPLADGAQAWADWLLSLKPVAEGARAGAWKEIRDAGCDIREVGRYARKLYQADYFKK